MGKGYGVLARSLLLVGFLSAWTVAAQPTAPESKTLTINRATTAPTIDGLIDATEWAEATIVEDFHQTQPIEFSSPSERMRVYVMYDADTLYVAAKNFDSEPDRIAAKVLRQGENLFDDDTFGIVLDSFHDRRNGYWFEVNPNGVRRQAIFQNTTTRNFNWNGIWQAMGRRDADGWSAEMAIPMKTLSFNGASDTWGINFRRKIERRQEFIGWVSRNQQVNPAASGTATGLHGLNQGIGLDVIPSVSFRHERTYAPEADDQDIEPSLDAFYKITPALTAALTLNTDFSATEVDDREVNLTRFGLFFPEKRAFFLQDADIFEFGRLTSDDNETEISNSSLENGRPFFSRRIGLSADGTPVDLRVGGKLTGRVGNWNVGLLNVQQVAYEDVDSRNLLVGRAVVNVLEESSAGVILTHGDPRSNLDNTVIGADFRYQNTRLPGNNVMEAEVWFQQSDTENVTGNDMAYGVRVAMPNESGLQASLGVKELQENFYPALGFLNNPGIRDYTLTSAYIHRRDGRVSTIAAALETQQIDVIEDNALQTRIVWVKPLVIETTSGEEFELGFGRTKEALYEPFEISDGVVIAPGEYSFDEYGFEIETGGHRAIAGNLRTFMGDFYTGERLSVEGGLTWRPSPHFALSGEYEYNDIDLPEGEFIARLLRARMDLVFSSTLSWSNLLQYDNESELVGINSRLQWIPQAGRETYFVVNHALQDFDRNNRYESQNADVVLKVGYTFRF